jgi:hypothetical protein
MGQIDGAPRLDARAPIPGMNGIASRYSISNAVTISATENTLSATIAMVNTRLFSMRERSACSASNIGHTAPVQLLGLPNSGALRRSRVL